MLSPSVGYVAKACRSLNALAHYRPMRSLTTSASRTTAASLSSHPTTSASPYYHLSCRRQLSSSATSREELLYDSKRVISRRLWSETFSTVLAGKTLRLPNGSRGTDISVSNFRAGGTTGEISRPVGRVRHGDCSPTKSGTPEQRRFEPPLL